MSQFMPVQVDVIVQDYFFAPTPFPDEAIAPQVDGGIQNPLLKSNRYSSPPITATVWEAAFRTWLGVLHPDLSSTGCYELSLRLTNDAEIQTLNAQYRHIDQPTDVLAFATLEVEYPEPEDLELASPLYLGDIVISVETAQQQAEQQHHSLAQELAWLAAHGLLHLLGWDHPDEDSLTRMLQQQAILLQAVGFT